ncbi:ryncolin-4-like [Saccostrea cucullata]|uniref:ryncolin-4-like n=1 Tax=Saccostrea cuccullata TaxID=36930 RepID=UPI002ED3047E
MDGSTDFQGKKWADYARGNDAIHVLTKAGNQKLRIDVTRFSGVSGNATYSTFIVNNATNKYKLTIGGYKGSAGFKDNMSYHNGMYFSTTDSGNDQYGSNCAEKFGNGWWFNQCHRSNLNGKDYRKPSSAFNALTWYKWSDKNLHGHLKSAQMMIKPK